MDIKIWAKVHILQLPRWFAIPFFGFSAIMGVVLAGGSFTQANTWLILFAVLFAMAGGHSLNSFLDYAWTGLDKGEKEDRSAEKSYTGGQNLIENGKVGLKGIILNAITWYILSAILLILVSRSINNNTTRMILFYLWLAGMVIPFWYSQAKFTTWSHELSLGIGVGPLPLLLGMFAVNSHPPIITGLLVSIIPAVVLSFAGLGLDEWPDAEANLKKGVKSISFKIWEYSSPDTIILSDSSSSIPTHYSQLKQYGSINTLQWYLTMWFMMLFGFQLFLIQIGDLKPLTGLVFIMLPPILCSLVFLRKNFNRVAMVIVVLAAIYLILILIGQALGR
jgi:4-hydroxybenzoate polyprenyltransferase